MVSVYDRYENNPWRFANTVVDPIAKKVGDAQLKAITSTPMGSGDESLSPDNDINDRFNEVDIIGNPTIALLKNMKKFLLVSTATPFSPYYPSLMDAYAWRFTGLEKYYPGARIPGIHEVGHFLVNDWGPLYPRNGFVPQPNRAKAAAVVTMRAATIATQSGQPHLYRPMSNDCGIECKAAHAKENNQDVQFQLIYPNTDKQCVVFGSGTMGLLQP